MGFVADDAVVHLVRSVLFDRLVGAEVEVERGIISTVGTAEKVDLLASGYAFLRLALEHFATVFEPAGERAEFEFSKQRQQLAPVHRRPPERVPIEVHVEVGFDGDELFAQARVVGVVEQAFAGLFTFDVLGMVKEVFDRAIFGDELGGGFGADAGHAGHVVAGVAHQSQHVDKLDGLDAVLFAEAVVGNRVEIFTTMGGAKDRNALAEELLKIFIGRDDDHLRAVGFGVAGERADDIIRLNVFLFDYGNVEGLNDFFDPRQIGQQVVRWRVAMGFIVFVHLRTKRLARPHHVEDDGHVVDLVIFDELEQRVGKTVAGRGVLPLRVDQRPADEDEMRPIGQRHRVDEIKTLGGAIILNFAHVPGWVAYETC